MRRFAPRDAKDVVRVARSRPYCLAVTPSVPDLDSDAIAARLRAAGCVFAEDEARLLIEAAGSPDDLAAMIARRVDGEPLEYVVGWVDFAGLRIAIEPG